MINTQSGISGVLYQGVSGLNASTRSTVESANEIVLSGVLERAPTRSTDIVEPLINIQQQQHDFNASAKVINIADQALGVLLDTNA